MPEERYIQLIAKHLAGETTKVDEERLNQWLRVPENKQIYLFYEAMWEDSRLKYKTPRSESVFQSISKNINKEGSQQKNIRLRKPPSAYLLTLAAIFVFIIISFVSLLIISKDSGKRQQVQMLERSLPKGQKMKIFLPDGSIVWLNAESTLRYPERFDAHQRRVFLKGEAYFEVEKDPEKPFTVVTDHIDVTALGTSFNVRDYGFEEKVLVALHTGKVLVRDQSSKEQLTLIPLQGAIYDKNDGKIDKNNIDPELSFLWKDGVLCFKDAPFNEVFEKLERWYGVDFKIENYQGDTWFYTGKFEENEYLSNVLKSISYTKGFTYTIDQNKVLIKF